LAAGATRLRRRSFPPIRLDRHSPRSLYHLGYSQTPKPVIGNDRRVESAWHALAPLLTTERRAPARRAGTVVLVVPRIFVAAHPGRLDLLIGTVNADQTFRSRAISAERIAQWLALLDPRWPFTIRAPTRVARALAGVCPCGATADGAAVATASAAVAATVAIAVPSRAGLIVPGRSRLARVGRTTRRSGTTGATPARIILSAPATKHASHQSPNQHPLHQRRHLGWSVHASSTQVKRPRSPRRSSWPLWPTAQTTHRLRARSCAAARPPLAGRTPTQ
jgi:hypothetical protein